MQKMLCDAFLFKNVICVINSRMCLALECLTLFLLSLFNWERKILRDTNGSLYISWEFSFSEREREGKRPHEVVFLCFGGFVCVCVGRGGYVFNDFNEVAQCQEHWRRFIFFWGEERSILLEVMRSNILERGELWDIICLGVRGGLLKAVYFMSKG